MSTLEAGPASAPPLDAIVARAKELAPLVEAEADACEQLGTMPQPVVDALRDAGMFALMIPRELGGAEVDPATALTVFEELTAADASIGWSLMANATASAMTAYLGDDAVKVMFAEGPAIVAGQFSPKGPAIPEDGGYRVHGHYSFGSGSAHATWIGGGAVEMDGDVPRMAGGRPVIRAYFVPQKEVEFLGNWDVMGLVGTGSYDYAVSERVVPAGFTFELVNARQHRGGPLYGLGVLGMTSIGHAGFALGVGQRALREVLSLAGRKQRLGHTTTVAGFERFQYELGHYSALLRAARGFVFDVFAAAQSQLEAGATLTEGERLSLRQATTHVTHVCRDVVDFAYHWAGADGIRPGALQRCWRDAHASTQHIFVDDSTLAEYGRHLLAEAGSLPA